MRTAGAINADSSLAASFMWLVRTVALSTMTLAFTFRKILVKGRRKNKYNITMKNAY